MSLLGIRVSWTINPEYLNCQLSNLNVELNRDEHSRDITVSDSSVDFYNLDCNKNYTPRVTASLSLTDSTFEIQGNGDMLFYGGTTLVVQLSLSS